MDATSRWLQIPLFVLFIPPSILFFIQIIAICKIKSLHSPFYWLYIIRALNIIFYELFQIYEKLPHFGLFIGFYKILPRILLTLAYFPTIYFYYCDNLAAIFMILYRLTGIAIPLKHKMFWKFAFPLAILIIFGAPFPFCTFLLEMDAYLDSKNESIYSIKYNVRQNETSQIIAHSTQLDELNPMDPLIRLITESTYFAICSIPICLLLNLLTLWAFRFKKNLIKKQNGHQNSSSNSNSNLNIERKLIAFIIATIFCHSGFLIFQVLTNWLWHNDLIAIGTIFSRLNEIAFIVGEFAVPTFLLHWTSPRLGEHSFETIKCLIPCHFFSTNAIATNIALTHVGSKPPTLRHPCGNN